MNIFKKFYCRTYQMVFKLIMPFLPYREPKLLNNNKELAEVLKQNNISKVLLVTGNSINKLGLTNALQTELKKAKIKLVIYDDTTSNPTTQNVEDAYNVYKKHKCQAIIALGGGSPIDCAKATGIRVVKPNKQLSKMKGVLKVGKKLPLLIAIPTTAGTGSETTLAAVITDAETRHKYAINDFPLIPKYAMLDAELTLGLPKNVTSTTGMDALTHAIEAYIGNSTTKKTRKAALIAIKLIFENLLIAYNDGSNYKARQNMLRAAYCAGIAFTRSYVGYVHAIAHTLGGKYNISHGLANAVILPYMLKAYGKTIYNKLYEIGLYIGMFKEDTEMEEGAKIFIKKIEDLNKKMDIPNSIKEIKLQDIKELSKTAEKEANPLYPVPKLFTAEELQKIYIQVKNGRI